MRCNKYGNKSCKCLMLHSHDSIWEADVCNYLYSLVRDRRIYSWTTQESIDLTVRGKTICSHIVDFKVHKNDGKYFWAEAKGFATPTWQLKRKLVKALYPRIPYVTVYRGQLNLIDEQLRED